MLKSRNGLMRKIYLIFGLVLILGIAVQAADRKITLDSLNVNNDQLYISYHIDGLLDAKTIQGLERGLTSEVIHKIRLWKSKKLFSSISTEKVLTVKILYDNWEDKFRIVTDDENRLTSQVQTVRDMSSLIRNYMIIPVEELESDTKYYISIQTTLKPVSAETYHELSEWLSGPSRIDDKEKPKKSGQNRIFDVFMNVLGFGETELKFKSENFFYKENNTIQFMQ